jgi:hypothetical protein
MAGKTFVELGRRADLSADCANCVGLCCVALAFDRSAAFAYDKEPGEPCVHLEQDFRCKIHPVLRERGFTGCTVFDCFGAGQKVTQQTFDGRSWREDGVRGDMFAVFPIVRRLQQLLWYLDAALAFPGVDPLRAELTAAFSAVEALTLSDAAALLRIDTDDEYDAARPLLLRASEAARSRYPQPLGKGGGRPIRPGADLVGANLRGADLRGADLRAALLLGADLRSADLRGADLIGADLRDADVAGADLSETLFLTQMQVNSARGSSGTRLPAGFVRPSHWSSR